MSAPPGPVPSAVMREVLGHFVSGIVVITAVGPAGPLGFTCQSFASLSLDPPLVSFAPARTSTTWPQIRAVGAFCVNVLAAGHEELSAAGSPARAWTSSPGWTGIPGRPGSPVLDGVSAWIDCTLWNEYDGGDHTVVVGLVQRPGRGAGPAAAAVLPRSVRRGEAAS